MKIGNYDPTRPGMIFFDPDTGANPSAPAAAPDVAVPAAESPTGMPIPQAPSPTAKPVTIIEPKPVIKQPGIIDVKKALNLPEAPSKTLTRMAKELQQRTRPGAIPVPRPKAKAVAESKIEPEPQTDGEKSTPAAPEAVKPTKVTVNGKEYTPDELAKYVSELEKGKEAPKPTEPPQPPQPPQPKPTETPLTADQKAEQDKKLDEEWFSKALPQYTTSEEDLDILLSGGQKAVQLYAKHRAQDALATRTWFEQQINPILADLHNSITPAVEMARTVQEYQEEASLFTEFSDLKPFQKFVRRIGNTLREKYPNEMAVMTPEQRRKQIAESAQSMIKELGIQPDPVEATATPQPSPNGAVPKVTPIPTAPAEPTKPKPPQPQPATGQLGGTRPPAAVDEQAAHIAKLRQYEESGRRKA